MDWLDRNLLESARLWHVDQIMQRLGVRYLEAERLADLEVEILRDMDMDEVD